MAVHFAIRDPRDDGGEDAFVYILEPERLDEPVKAIHNESGLAARWTSYVKEVRSKRTTDFKEYGWEDAYLPGNRGERAEFEIPRSPLVLDFPHITRRGAAQRRRFMVFGSDHEFLARESHRGDSTIWGIVIDGACRTQVRRELRDNGVTESVIYPDLDGVGREMKQLREARR